ncbi:DUF2799 domain-containing protein [Vibrio cholerae]
MRTGFFFILIILGGCSASTNTEADFWYRQGVRFGQAGYTIEPSVLEEIKSKVPFDEIAYLEGYKIGKSKYCDPFKAFEKGVSGIRYDGQCKGIDNELLIKTEWQRGWDAFIGADFYRVR